MAVPTSNLSNNPNARYDCGPNAAGCGRIENNDVRVDGFPDGLGPTGVVTNTTLRVGQGVAGALRTNTGPNTAGTPASIHEE